MVGVRRALLAGADDDVHETADVLNALERATLRLLLLFLLRDLRGLTTNLRERERAAASVTLVPIARAEAITRPHARADARRPRSNDRRVETNISPRVHRPNAPARVRATRHARARSHALRRREALARAIHPTARAPTRDARSTARDERKTYFTGASERAVNLPHTFGRVRVAEPTPRARARRWTRRGRARSRPNDPDMGLRRTGVRARADGTKKGRSRAVTTRRWSDSSDAAPRSTSASRGVAPRARHFLATHRSRDMAPQALPEPLLDENDQRCVVASRARRRERAGADGRGWATRERSNFKPAVPEFARRGWTRAARGVDRVVERGYGCYVFVRASPRREGALGEVARGRGGREREPRAGRAVGEPRRLTRSRAYVGSRCSRSSTRRCGRCTRRLRLRSGPVRGGFERVWSRGWRKDWRGARASALFQTSARRVGTGTDDGSIARENSGGSRSLG